MSRRFSLNRLARGAKSRGAGTFAELTAKLWMNCRCAEQMRIALVRLMTRIFTSDFTSRNLCRYA
jgi:hypothetical protein